MSKDKRLKVGCDMPVLRRTQKGEDWCFEKDEIVNWVRDQPELIGFVIDQMKTNGYIVYDQKSGLWYGKDHI